MRALRGGGEGIGYAGMLDEEEGGCGRGGFVEHVFSAWIGMGSLACMVELLQCGVFLTGGGAGCRE